MSTENRTLESIIENQKEFSLKTFGPPNNNKLGLADHIRKELDEILETEDGDSELAEWIDVIILGIDGAWRCGPHTPELIVQQLLYKIEENKRRKWPDWRTAEPGKAIEHIKDEHDQ